ncbi:MAG: M1 family metallopeptidase [Candidatus Hodarchaeota archaeon]
MRNGNELKPIHYKIHLEPNLDTFKFTGIVEIKIEVLTAVQKIVLNSFDLAIWSCMIVDESKEEKAIPFQYDPNKQELSLLLSEPIEGQIKVRIEYMGKINDSLVGFYRSRYTIDNETRYLAVTQFEETYARQSFPCFDHPSKKATFDIELAIDEALQAIANTPIIEEKILENGKKLIVFETTPKMCSYLLFFGVGEFEFIQEKFGDVLHRVATPPGKTQYASFALDFSQKAQKFGEEYTGVKYPLGKMDQIAVSDFAFGAMENYGAITYRENLLLVYPGITSSAGLERIAEIIAHEWAHQWFGNLVSPLDWKYLWLNESFATLFGYAIADHFHPEWNIWDQFLANETNGAFERDSLINTFPIELPGEGDTVKITAATAPIIYNKGAAILQMIRGYLGEDKFKKGINHFLKKYKFSNAVSGDYWTAFEEATNEPFKEIMSSWIHQPGYPFIEVERNGNEITLTQKRFTYNPFESNQTWITPITISIYNKNREKKIERILLRDKTVKFTLPEDTTAFKINTEQTGFYRVKYDNKDLENLGKLILDKVLSPNDRFGLQNDLYAFVRRGNYSIDDYLDFLQFYEAEDAYLPLNDIGFNLLHAYNVIDSKRGEIAATGLNLFSDFLKEMGYEPQDGELHTTSLLRSILLWIAFRFGDEEVAEFGSSKFAEIKQNQTIHPDIRATTMRIGAALDASLFDWFIEKFEAKETEEEERINILRAIGSFGDHDTLEKVLAYTLEKVPDKNKYIPVLFAASNPAIVKDMWPWYLANIERLEKIHFTLYERIIQSVVSLSGLGREEEVKDFLEAYKTKNEKVKDTIIMTLERLDINSRLRNIKRT